AAGRAPAHRMGRGTALAQRQRRAARDPRRGSACGWPRDPLSRRRQIGRRVSAVAAGARGDPQATQGGIRSARHLEPGPHVRRLLMQTALADWIKDTPQGREAEAILRKCVHCGFCNATCPTYQLLGDELDGPRGRIYLMKRLLEGAEVTRKTQLHLDRCLT